MMPCMASSLSRSPNGVACTSAVTISSNEIRAEQIDRVGPRVSCRDIDERPASGLGLPAIAARVAAVQRRGQIAAEFDATQLALEVYSFMELANFHFVLFRDPEVLERGQRAAAGALDAARAGT